jgi:hypothetical protein
LDVMDRADPALAHRSAFAGLAGVRRESHVRVAEHLVMSDPERLDPTLLAAGQRDEEAQLNQFGFGEVGV